jgi:hypothetical protein
MVNAKLTDQIKLPNVSQLPLPENGTENVTLFDGLVHNESGCAAKWALLMARSYLLGQCGHGGIGRRATLRSLWPKGRGSSSLLGRTILLKKNWPLPARSNPASFPGHA